MTGRLLYLLRGIKQYIGIKTSRIYELVYKLHNMKPANTLTKTPNPECQERKGRKLSLQEQEENSQGSENDWNISLPVKNYLQRSR